MHADAAEAVLLDRDFRLAGTTIDQRTGARRSNGKEKTFRWMEFPRPINPRQVDAAMTDGVLSIRAEIAEVDLYASRSVKPL